MNFEALRVDELRAILVNSGHFTEETANVIKGKSNIVYEVKKLINDNKLVLTPENTEEVSIDSNYIDNMVDSAIDNIENNIEENINKLTEQKIQEMQDEVFAGPATPKTDAKYLDTKPLSVTDDGWQTHVMSQFLEDELIKGNPTVAGLRRVAEKLLGEIVFSGPTQFTPSTDGSNNGRASVMYKIEIAWMNGMSGWVDLNTDIPTRTFVSVAEAWDGNVPEGIFQRFPLTIAETRAEGRALRKALHLRNVLAAEELSGSELPTDKIPVVQEWNENDKASSQQLGTIQLICNRLGVDYNKVIRENMTRQEAVEVLKELSAYSSTDKPIPTNILKGN